MQYFTQQLFADADNPYADARYVIYGVPYDGTVSYMPGTRLGPRAIRDVSYNFESYLPDFDLDLLDVPVADLGDIEPFSLPDDVVEQVELAVHEFHRDGKLPIMIGGEHSVTPGAVKVLKPACYLVCDAHLDLRDEYGGTSDSHACATRRVMDCGVEDVYIIGARSGTKEEYELAKDLHLYSAEDVRRLGIDKVIDEIRTSVGDRSLYLSVDADGIDCCLTPGLGTPEPFGLTPLDVRDVVRAFAPAAVGFDYVEVCPNDSGQTAAVAARIIRDFIAAHWCSEHPGL